MNLKIPVFLIALSFVCAINVQAKDLKSTPAATKAIPVSAPSEPKGYEQAKKALTVSLSKPTVKEKAAEVLIRAQEKARLALNALFHSMKKALHEKLKKHHGKKDKHHGNKHKPQPQPAPVYDVTTADAVYPYDDGTTLSIKYAYDEPTEANPFNFVMVNYDSVTKELQSVVGYTRTVTDVIPDVSGMTLVSTSVRPDGSIASRSYQASTGDVVTTVTIDGSGYAVITRAQTLDKNSVILPAA